LRNASTNPGSIVSPPTNSSEVSSQSTLPSFRAMKPSRLAAMWIVTRESVFAIVPLYPYARAACAFYEQPLAVEAVILVLLHNGEKLIDGLRDGMRLVRMPFQILPHPKDIPVVACAYVGSFRETVLTLDTRFLKLRSNLEELHASP
jgi:hypothetical protein